MPIIDDLLSRIGLRATAPVGPDEYVGVVEMSPDALKDLLGARGYVWNPLAAYKTEYDDGDEEIGSYRKIHGRKQTHVMIFPAEGEDYTEVYAHHEYNWATDPVKHYLARGQDPESGVRRVRSLLNIEEVTWWNPS